MQSRDKTPMFLKAAHLKDLIILKHEIYKWEVYKYTLINTSTAFLNTMILNSQAEYGYCKEEMLLNLSKYNLLFALQNVKQIYVIVLPLISKS